MASFEERFKLNAAEWVETDMKILDLELKGEEVPEELYEKRFVHWDNIHFILDQVIDLELLNGPVSES
jgi:hypothetical protein